MEHAFECRLAWTGASLGQTHSYDAYSRELRIDFEGKPSLAASAAPAFRGDSSLHNPEDLLVAALSACHCLTYLALCSRAGILVISYDDAARGTMRPVDGVMRFTDVLLKPRVTISSDADIDKATKLHERAHAGCFIANSVNFPVRNEPLVSRS